MWLLGFGVQGLGFRVQGLGCRVQGLGFRVQGLGASDRGNRIPFHEVQLRAGEALCFFDAKEMLTGSPFARPP